MQLTAPISFQGLYWTLNVVLHRFSHRLQELHKKQFRFNMWKICVFSQSKNWGGGWKANGAVNSIYVVIAFNNFQIQFQSKIFENEGKKNLERNSLLQKLTISQFPILIFQKHTPSSLFTKQSIFCISKLLKLQFRSKYKCVYIKLLLSTKKVTVKRFYFWHPSC